MRRLRSIVVLSAMLVAACKPEPLHVLGTLERDRISLPSPSFERIARIDVHEGEDVQAGAVLMSLETDRSQARRDAAGAEVARAQAALEQARTGPRREAIAEAQARLHGSQSVALNARQEFQRVSAIVQRKLLPAAELDRARAARDAADADVASARAALAALQNGSRSEELAQAEAVLEAAVAQQAGAQIDLDRIDIRAPRAGRVESLPYKAGDQPSVGAPLAILLVGEKPYARVYVPQPLRAQWAIGARVDVTIAGDDQVRAGAVRAIRSEPTFTPYYALSGKDVARLSYVAEVELGDADAGLAIGMPVTATLAGDAVH